MEWIFYLADICGNLGKFFIITGVVFLVLFCICSFVGLVEEDAKDCYNEINFYPQKWIIPALLAILLGILIPSRQTVYTVGGVHVLENIVNNYEQIKQLPDKSIKALNTWLDSLIEENTKEEN